MGRIDSNTRNVAFCINDRYAKYLTVAIKSLVINNGNENIKIHILTDCLSEENENVIRKVASPFPVIVHKINNNRLSCLNDSWGISAWYRILLPDILKDEDKVLYLDADVIVDKNISHLFDFDMSRTSVSGAIDVLALNKSIYERLGYPSNYKYICSGVLMMNLEYWRNNNLTDQIIEFAIDRKDKIQFPDQDAINAICYSSKKILPMKYGVLDIFFRDSRFHTQAYLPELLEALDEPVIIHYAGLAPWVYERRMHQLVNRWDYYNKLLDSPVTIKHYRNNNQTMKEKLRNLLDYLNVWRIKRWEGTPPTSNKELRDMLLQQNENFNII